MLLHFSHHELGGLVNGVARPVPVNNHAIDTAADHVYDLFVNLGRVRRTVAHVHMVRSAEPEQEMSVDLGVSTGVQQGVDIHFAHVTGACVAVALAGETACGAGVVSSLRCQGCGWNHEVGGG